MIIKTHEIIRSALNTESPSSAAVGLSSRPINEINLVNDKKKILKNEISVTRGVVLISQGNEAYSQ